MQIKTTNEILAEDRRLIDNCEDVKHSNYMDKKWVSIEDIWQWAEDNPEDSFEELLYALDPERVEREELF